MSRIVSAVFLAVALSAALALADNKEPQENVGETIRYLLDYVAQSKCTFIRNGKAYDAGRASRHLEKKYRHFKKEIATPEDFIRLAATKSLQTGKPYKVRTKDGRELPCDEWMRKVLEEYRKTRGDSTCAAPGRALHMLLHVMLPAGREMFLVDHASRAGFRIGGAPRAVIPVHPERPRRHYEESDHAVGLDSYFGHGDHRLC
jgi:hypothetical protein